MHVDSGLLNQVDLSTLRVGPIHRLQSAVLFNGPTQYPPLHFFHLLLLLFTLSDTQQLLIKSLCNRPIGPAMEVFRYH